LLRSRAITALLPAADDDGAELDVWTHPQRARARRSVEVVRGQRQQVDAEVVDRQRNAPGGADGVDVKRHAARARRAPDLAQWLHRPDLAVGRHHRYERGVLAQGACDRLRIDTALAVYRHVGDLPTA